MSVVSVERTPGGGASLSKRIHKSLLSATSIASVSLVTAALLSSTSFSHAQQAENEQRLFNIPSLNLETAVAAFGRQSGLQVSLAASTASHIKTNAVNGRMDAHSALSLMLSDPGLYWWMSEDGVVIIPTASSPAGSVESDETVLQTIHVTDDSASGYRGTPDRVYEEPGGVSVVTRQAIEETGARDTRRIFDGVSGVYSGDGVGSFPTVSPNIRGLQDSGRVIVSVDGARLNAQDGGRYGGANVGGIGMAFVDPSFVREIDVQKKTEASANNAGSLSGATDFRLVGADNIISPGQKWGAEFNVSKGSNAYDFNGSAIGSSRIGDAFALTFGVSRKKMGQYEPGERGGEIEARFDLASQSSLSTFLKFEADFDDVTASFSWLHQFNEFAYATTADGFGSEFGARTHTLVADAAWSPENPLVDFSAKVWANLSAIDETREARLSTPETDIDKDLKSFGFMLENTSKADTAVGPLSLNYGVEAFRDVGDKRARSSSIDENPLYESSFGAFSPAGRRDIASAYLSGMLQPIDWVSVSGGLRYDWYRLKGSPTYYRQDTQRIPYTVGSVISEWDSITANMEAWEIPGAIAVYTAAFGPGYVPSLQAQMGEVINGSFRNAGTVINTTTTSIASHTDEIDRSEGALLPSATIEFKALEWLTPYASYSHSYRPPTLTEAFASGNIAPVNGVGTTLAPNLDLRAETARTYEIGANVILDQLFSDEDRFRMKVTGFYREVDDYIVTGTVIKDGEPDRTYTSFVNLDGTAKMKGLELEANYDNRHFWVGGSSTLMDITWPQRTETFDNGITSTDGDIFAWNSSVPPTFKLSLDAGVRFFEEKLSLGARMNHVTPTSAATLDSEGNTVEYSEAYTTFDLHGSYKVADNVLVSVSAENITDLNYVPATGVYLAPGRTIKASLKIKF